VLPLHHTANVWKIAKPIKTDTEALLRTSREDGLEINTEKTKYMAVSRHQNTGKNNYLIIFYKSSENVAMFIHLGTTGTNQKCIHYEIKSKLISGNVFAHSVQSFIS
jgi:hypothetical protein